TFSAVTVNAGSAGLGRLSPRASPRHPPSETLAGEVNDGCAVGRLGLVPLDERVAADLLPHRGPHGAGAAAVDDADRSQACERGIVDERPDRLPRVVRALASHVEHV